MPAQELSTSEFVKTLSKKKGALKKARTVEPQVFGQQVPAGITGGIAKLTSVKLQKAENGSPYVAFVGVVQRPEEFRGSQIFVSNFLTGNEYQSDEESLSRFCSNLKLLGCTTDDLEPEHFQGELERLQRKQPLFKFRTTKSKSTKNPDRVNVFIQGVADESEVAESDVEEEIEDDDVEANEDAEDEEDESAPAPSSRRGGGGGKKQTPPDDDEDEDDDEEETEDEDAEDDDEDLIDWQPTKGEIIEYAPSGKKMYPCEIRIVNEKAKTITLKRQSDGKVFKGVSWDDEKLGDVLVDDDEAEDDE